MAYCVRGQSVSRALQDPRKPGSNRSSGAGPAGNTGMAAGVPRSVPRGSDVSNLWAGHAQGTSRAALEQELPDRKDQADSPATRYPGPAHYVSGDAPNTGYSSSASRDTQ